jgi:hypothetical protein
MCVVAAWPGCVVRGRGGVFWEGPVVFVLSVVVVFLRGRLRRRRGF